MDGKLWFCTNNTKDVYKDMQANPIFEVLYLKDAHAVIADFSGNPPREYDL